MKPIFGLIAVLALSLFSTTGMAATMTFWATTSQSDTAWDPTPLSEGATKTININYSQLYNLGSNLIINSAKLMLLAVDDYGSNSRISNNMDARYNNHCSAQGQTSNNCKDDNNSRTVQDPSEQAKIIGIENRPFDNGTSIEIDAFKWYDLNINVASFLSKTDKNFSATIKAVCGDFWYKNSKIVVDYSLRPVPIPAAVWLFGSALLGLTGIRRKSA